MENSIYKYMKPGLIHPMAYPETIKGEGPVVETIRKIAMDDYFTAIEITHIEDENAREEARKILESSGLAIGFAAQPVLLTRGLNINDINEEKRQEAVNVMKDAIDEAYFMSSQGLAFLAGKYEEETKQKAYDALVKSTKEICNYAKSKGNLNILLEVFDYDVDKKALIGPVDLAKKYAEEITAECDNFGLMVDLSHLPLLRETPEQSILPIKDYIWHAHMGNAVIEKECKAYGDAHPRFGFPNSANGVDEMVDFLRVLLDIGFLNSENPPIVSFEVKPWGDEDPDVVVANAKRTLNIAWSKL